LQAGDQAGLAMHLKMLQRVSEFASAYRNRQEGDLKTSLRGDGIVVVVGRRQANHALALVRQVANVQADSFEGRETPPIPMRVANGVAIGDEPAAPEARTPATLRDTVSLTSHRDSILQHVTKYVQSTGKTGQEAIGLYRWCLADMCRTNGVNPRNIAFDA
jgi:hypothetical protein